MWNTIKGVAGALFKSKKFVGMIVGMIVALAAKVGLEVDDETVTKLVMLAASYVLGQGIADHGKEAALISGGASSE